MVVRRTMPRLVDSSAVARKVLDLVRHAARIDGDAGRSEETQLGSPERPLAQFVSPKPPVSGQPATHDAVTAEKQRHCDKSGRSRRTRPLRTFTEG